MCLSFPYFMHFAFDLKCSENVINKQNSDYLGDIECSLNNVQ